MTAACQVHDRIAVITLNNPPVNGLGLVTRQAVSAPTPTRASLPSF